MAEDDGGIDTDDCRSSISLPAAMNYASTTADGKMLAAVGDSTEVYIFVNESGRWRRYAEIAVAEDPCFSAVFSPSQQYLAIGSQDVCCNPVRMSMGKLTVAIGDMHGLGHEEAVQQYTRGRQYVWATASQEERHIRLPGALDSALSAWLDTQSCLESEPARPAALLRVHDLCHDPGHAALFAATAHKDTGWRWLTLWHWRPRPGNQWRLFLKEWRTCLRRV